MAQLLSTHVNRFRPIFYIIQHISSARYYAGYKSNKMAFFQEGGYNTSCAEILDLISKEGFSAFQIMRIRYFETGEEALEYETRFLHRVKASSNPRFFNQHNGDGKFIRKYYSKESGEKISKSLMAISCEQKAEIAHKISEALKGKSYLTEEGRRRISQASKGNQHAKGNRHSGKHSIEGRASIGQATGDRLRGISLNDEHKEKIAIALKINNPMCNIENRAKVAASKCGNKKLKHAILPFKWAKPGTPKWDELIAQGYK